MKDTLVALNESDGKVTADVAVADTGNIFSQYLNPTKEKDVLGDSEVTVAYEVYGRCAQRYSESWKVGDKDIKFAKAQQDEYNDIVQSFCSEGIDKSDRDIIDFIKEIMAEEHSVKSDMITMLKQQILVLKEELLRKQSIIEKLLKVPRVVPCTQCQSGNPQMQPNNNNPNISLKCCNSQFG